MLNDVLKAALTISVSGSLIALVLLLLRPFIQNKFSRKWYYYIWLIVIARLIVPLGLPINIINLVPAIESTPADKSVLPMDGAPVDEPILPVDAAETEYIEVPLQQDVSDMEMNTLESSAIPTEKTETIEFRALFPFIGYAWLFIVLFLFTQKLINYYRFVQLIKATSGPIDNDAILDISYDACKFLGIKKELPVLFNRTIGSPMLMGLFKPIIVLPEAQMENIPQLKYVFMHELTHYKRFDIYYKWLMQIVLCVHWFNPVVYLVGKEVNRTCELSCDESVIKRLAPKEQRAYGDTLLRSFEITSGYNNSVVSLTLTENSKLMKERLGTIMKFHKKSKLATCAATVLAVILCTGAMFTGVQGRTVNNDAEIKAASTANSLPVTADDLHNIQPIPFTSIGARAYSSKWASVTGIEATTYKKQLDEKIKWAEDLYSEKKERFMLNETISEKEITNTLGIRYMYEKSSVYRDMANTGETFTLLPYDSSFSRWGSKKYYERSVFYVDKPAVMTLSIFYELSEGKIALWLVSPEGEIFYVNTPTSRYDDSITWSVSAGLWSIITVNESETGTVCGTQKIQGKIASTENLAVPVDIPKTTGKIYVKNYGKYELNKDDTVVANLDWKGEGHVMFLYTMEEFDTKGITQLVKKGVLPLGSVAKALTNGYDNIPSLSSNFTYVENNKELKLNFTTTPNKPIYWSNKVPKTGSYYIYVIATGDTGITDIKGDITFPVSTTNSVDSLSTLGFPGRLTKDQLPNNLKSWIEECDKKQDLYLISKNNRWYIYCNLVTGNYTMKIDNVTEPGSVLLTISDSAGKGEGYVLLSAPNYDNIKVFYKDKNVQFTGEN